jgi:capsular polysaccharide biosynthesis protein
MSDTTGRSTKAAARSAWRRLSLRSVVGGLVTAALVGVIGVALFGSRSVTWTASSPLLILPAADVAAQSGGASYYDTLNQGQIVATFAQVLQASSTPGQRPRTPGLSSDQASEVTVTVNAVPNTSIIDITVYASTADLARQAANGVAAASLGTLKQLGTPYRASIISPAEPTLANPAGPSPLTLGFVIAAVAVLAGVGAQQVLWLTGAVTARRSMSRTSTEPSRPYPADQSPLHRNVPAKDGTAVGSAARPLE